MNMETIYERTRALKRTQSAFCPGCMHGLVTKLIGETLEEMGVLDETIGVMSVGCSVLSRNIFDFDIVCANHGRAPAVATGITRCAPDRMVFTMQGDGDLASIGLAEIMCAANRGENFAVIFINNSTYGMTGGQMAPTTLIGQKSTTTQLGRVAREEGFPMKMCEIMEQLEAPRLIARYALDTPETVLEAKSAIRKAFELQKAKKGFSFVELLSNCPTNWGMTAVDSLQFMRSNTMEVFPQKVFREV